MGRLSNRCSALIIPASPPILALSSGHDDIFSNEQQKLEYVSGCASARHRGMGVGSGA